MKTFSSIVIVLWIVAMYFLFSLVIVKAELTPNLLSNNFTDGSWSGTNLTSKHGNNTIAGKHEQYVESTISLIDDAELHKVEFGNGFESRQSSDIWFWNSNSQSVLMKQTVVSNSGNTITQTKEINGSCEQYNGCDYNSSGNNTIIINQNTESDYDIISRFSFSVPNNQIGHTGADIKNPSLVISYEEPDFYNLDDTLEIIEEIQWEDDVFEEFYFEEFKEEEFFTSPPSINFQIFEMPQDYIMEYKDYIIEYENFETEYEIEPEYEMFSDEIETFFTKEEFTEMPEEMFEEMFEEFLEEMPEEFTEIIEEEIDEKEITDNESKEEFEEESNEEFEEEFDEELVLTESKENIEEVKEESNIKEIATEENIVVKEKLNIKSVVIKTKIDMLKFENKLKFNFMLKNVPILNDVVFYPITNIYKNQLLITDNRDIYSNVKFVDDPLNLFENKLRENKEQQYFIKSKLEYMTWKH